MKVFKLRETSAEGGRQAAERLKYEIAILKQNRPDLPQLLGWNEEERWIVTEFFPDGTLETHPDRYKGQAALALRAFRSLVETVAWLHKEKIVHRDIKPPNVFIRKDDELVLGDFGIAYLPNQGDRITVTDERVGPRDYMPPWADVGGRLENVQPNFDVYMLGKLLWCMVAGRPRLPRERYKQKEFNLAEMFPDNPDMHIINSILDRCVVEEPSHCLESAQQLLAIADEGLTVLGRGGQLLSDGIPRPCHVCGKGFYRPGAAAGPIDAVFQVGLGQLVNQTFQHVAVVTVRPFACDHCGHVELFKK